MILTRTLREIGHIRVHEGFDEENRHCAVIIIWEKGMAHNTSTVLKAIYNTGSA